MLQYQNQKLSQQLEVQRLEIHELEEKTAHMQQKQAKYDDTLISVNRAWTQLVEDLELLVCRSPSTANGLGVLEPSTKGGSSEGSLAGEQTFLHRLLGVSVKENGAESDEHKVDSESRIEAALAARRVQTSKVVSHIVQAIELQRQKNDQLAAALRKSTPETDVSKLLWQRQEDMQGELASTRSAMDALHVRHRAISSENAELHDTQAIQEVELKKLRDRVDDMDAQLETARRKIVASKQRESLSVPLTSSSLPLVSPSVKTEPGMNGVPDKMSPGDSVDLRTALDEAQKLAARRLSEVEDAHKVQLDLTTQLRQLQTELSDEQRVHSSRPYHLLNEQVLFLRGEVERYRLQIEQVQRERDGAVLREKEAVFKADTADALRRSCVLADSRAKELEVKLQQCMAERDGIQRLLEETHAAAGRKETVAELKVMISTLHKEMNMMHGSLSKYKEQAREVHTLRADAQSLASILERKGREAEELEKRCARHVHDIKGLKEEVEHLRENEQETKIFLEMFERETPDPRDVLEIKQAERRAIAMVERMKTALDEHALALRVKVANEAEAACQQRLTAAENEVNQLRTRLDAAERSVLELKDTLVAKNEEGETYMSEIETIGQAYEDMQSQNRHLLQQITERDDYNTQLMAESVKAKQLQTSLLAEKEALAGRMEHVNAVAEVHKQRVVRLEEQVKVCLEDLGKAAEENRQHLSNLEQAKRRQQEAEREAQLAKSAMEVGQRELEDRGKKLAEADVELEKERFKRKRLEEEVDMSSKKLARMGSDKAEKASSSAAAGAGVATVEELNQQILEYKSILKCSVCKERPKEVVITKCFHLFCSPCIQRNLEIRHRKCPGCGVPFGQSDVRNVYI
eukprot:TRINITY_DN3440_c0_g1_i2.p1 TRINITY_DN3440_c0_g1~~TRINITY_DN3440_c0_g1_i2.p1  ORF type:complete len:864 (+),score=221.59 TRINITY_DN3440_c0_g1_i2:160-2751(+)